MITAKLYWAEGILHSIDVQGHAKEQGRQDLCVAISCLLRSAAGAVSMIAVESSGQEKDFIWELLTPNAGCFSWHLDSWPEIYCGQLQGISRVLYYGLCSLLRDFNTAEQIVLDVLEESE